MGATYQISTGIDRGVRYVTPYVEPVLRHRGNAHGRVSRQPLETKNIFQRALVRITDWVKSRVVTARIRSAMAPFIKSVVKAVAPEPTAAHVSELKAAINAASTIWHGAEDVAAKAVRGSIDEMDRSEQITLREKLNGIGFSEYVRNGLLQAVNHSIAQSISRDADYLALEALKNIAGMFDGTDLIIGRVKFASAFICQHLQVVAPMEDSLFGKNESFSHAHQMACISASKDSAVLRWFASQSARGQKMILAAIHQTENPEVLKTLSETLEKERFKAFCIRMKEVLSKADTD